MFGFGKGTIDVVLDKYNYSPGEKIRGKAVLKLKKPIKARGIVAVFAGEKSTTQKNAATSRTETREDFIHRFEMKLDGEKEYTEGEYSFEIAVPKDILQRGAVPESGLGKAFQFMQVMSGSLSRITWYVEVFLDIPMGFDVRKRVQVNIS